jgi:hypothetical protein
VLLLVLHGAAEERYNKLQERLTLITKARVEGPGLAKAAKG